MDETRFPNALITITYSMTVQFLCFNKRNIHQCFTKDPMDARSGLNKQKIIFESANCVTQEHFSQNTFIL